MAEKAVGLNNLAGLKEWARDNFAKLEDVKPVTGSLTLNTDWTGTGPFKQVVTIAGATAKSKVDLQPDEIALTLLISGGIKALWVANDGGILTACALGAKPTKALTVQYTMMEVAT